jgi:RNA polymerase sigma-70 factor (ECF subfamily)
MSVEKAVDVAQPVRASPEQNGQHPDAGRRAALVNRAQAGDSEAFGLLYDEYSLSVYRYIYARVSSPVLAEDLTSETFVRALRALDSFRWQGRDFGAWLVTIARNLITDHFKSGRVRLESPTDEIETHDSATQGPEVDVLTAVTADVLRRAVSDLPDDQRDCLTMRFFAGMSIAETARALEKSEGAVKQLQLRAVRQLAKVIPKDLR